MSYRTILSLAAAAVLTTAGISTTSTDAFARAGARVGGNHARSEPLPTVEFIAVLMPIVEFIAELMPPYSRSGGGHWRRCTRNSCGARLQL